MCSICGRSTCNRNTSRRYVTVYGKYKPFSTEREVLGSVEVNSFDDQKTVRRKAYEKYPEWREIDKV